MFVKTCLRGIVLLFLSSIVLFAGVNFTLKTGLNYSDYTKERNTIPQIGYNISIGSEVKIIDKLSIIAEIQQITKNVILENRTILPIQETNEILEVYYWNIETSIHYFDIPFLISYSILENSNLKLKMIIGPSLSIPYKDKTKFKRRKFSFYYDYYDPISREQKFDYAFHKDEGFESNRISLLFDIGLRINWKIVFAEMKFMKDYRKEIYVKNINNFKGKSHSFLIYFGLKIP